MALAGRGDEDAFATILRRHYGAVTRYCARYTTGSGSAAAEDLAQEVFVRLWGMRARYQPTQAFRVLLYTIARNLCRTAHRDEERRPVRLVGPEALAELREAPGSSTELRLETRDVNRALGLLPEVQREALALRLGEGLEYMEIAEILGRSESTLRSQVFYGLKTLRQWLSR